MKQLKVLAATIVSVTLLFSTTGCDSNNGTVPVSQTNVAAPVTTPTVQPTTTPTASPTPTSTPLNLGPSILVANRASGTVSIVDVTTDTVTQTITLPAGSSPAQASYLSYSSSQDQIYVGDDANSRIVVFDGETLNQVDILAMNQDVFHIWNNGTQLWAVDRLAKVVSVFELSTGNKLADVPIPTDLETLGGEPHDVVVDDTHAYVTILGVTGDDQLVKFSTVTFSEVGRTAVGEDPHVTLHPTDRRVFVACQDSDNLFVIDRDTMIESKEISLLGGHGVWIPPQGQTLYVSNFPSHITAGTPGPGADGLFSVDLGSETESGSVATNPQAHNLVSTPDGTKLYLTHSNSAGVVTVFDISDPDGLPRNPSSISVGSVPFGIAYMP